MKKPSVNIILFLVLLFLCDMGQAQSKRTLNFPKEMETVEDMPSPDSLWIFIMAGQSNMAGRGLVEPQDTIPNKRILTIDKAGKWIYAKEPLHFYEPSMAGLDCGLSFAKELVAAVPEGISIGIIPSAIGGSSIEQWIADEEYRGVKLLSNFENKVALSQKRGTIKGILWHQGEANTKPALIPHYAQNLKKLTNTFRNIVGNDRLPIIIGELGSYAQPAEWQRQWDAINGIINKFAEQNQNTYVVHTQDLNQKGDHLHFDSASQRILGKRYADRYLDLIKTNVAPDHKNQQ